MNNQDRRCWMCLAVRQSNSQASDDFSIGKTFVKFSVTRRHAAGWGGRVTFTSTAKSLAVFALP
jgi:hypothetical protein